ncbi:acyltransferase [Streptomyces canus]|uniref:acyltransferase family protein n=1 Tax=Streptomyces canus TaxID=58343 RepID=UPI002E2DAA47|nr:acyltransferase [Streptomyces canus]
MIPNSRTTGGDRLPSLTGMRFVAAALVFVFHASLAMVFKNPDVSSDFTEAVAKAGTTGVSFFFVLSGFVLTWTAEPGDTGRRFWRRRLAKIYPNHLVGWVVALVLILATDQVVNSRDALTNLLLLQSWVPRFDVLFSMNDVSWSLSCELFFYLAFPLLLPLVARIRPERLWAWAGAVVAVIGCVPLLAELLPGQSGFDIYSFWLVYALPPVRALEFVLGMLMARIVLTGKWIPFIGLVPAGLLALAGYVLALNVPQLYSIVAATIVPIALVIPAAAVADLENGPSPFRGRLMVWLGEVSFAFYLLHRLVLTYGHRALGERRTWDIPEAVLLLVAALGLTLVLAALLYRLVERPAMRFIAGSARREPKALGRAPVPPAAEAQT